MEEEPTSLWRPVRTAGEEAKKRLEWYHESLKFFAYHG